MSIFRRSDRGVVAVEFALLLPLIVLLLFGIIQFGLAFAQVLSLNSGARQGARLGVVAGNSCATVIDATKSAAQTVALPASLVVVKVGLGPDPGCTGSVKPCAKRGDALTVTASRIFNVNIPFFDPVTLTGKGEYRCETD